MLVKIIVSCRVAHLHPVLDSLTATANLLSIRSDEGTSPSGGQFIRRSASDLAGSERRATSRRFAAGGAGQRRAATSADSFGEQRRPATELLPSRSGAGPVGRRVEHVGKIGSAQVAQPRHDVLGRMRHFLLKKYISSLCPEVPREPIFTKFGTYVPLVDVINPDKWCVNLFKVSILQGPNFPQISLFVPKL